MLLFKSLTSVSLLSLGFFSFASLEGKYFYDLNTHWIHIQVTIFFFPLTYLWAMRFSRLVKILATKIFRMEEKSAVVWSDECFINYEYDDLLIQWMSRKMENKRERRRRKERLVSKDESLIVYYAIFYLLIFSSNLKATNSEEWYLNPNPNPTDVVGE